MTSVISKLLRIGVAPDLDKERQRAMCEGKTAYVDKAAAMNVARHRMRRGKGLSRPYECPLCKKWHLTGQGSKARLMQKEKGTRPKN